MTRSTATHSRRRPSNPYCRASESDDSSSSAHKPTLGWYSGHSDGLVVDHMVNDLGLSLTDASCPSENICVFAGYTQPPSPGQEIPAVTVSTGPFTPHGSVVGTTTTLPQTSNYAWSFVACSGPTPCVLSSVDGLYATTDTTSAHWTLEILPSPEYSFGQVSCRNSPFARCLANVQRAESDPSWQVAPQPGPGTVGYPLPEVSCVSTSSCVTTTDGQLAVGKVPS